MRVLSVAVSRARNRRVGIRVGIVDVFVLQQSVEKEVLVSGGLNETPLTLAQFHAKGLLFVDQEL